MDELISRQDAINAISCDITITGRQNAELVTKTIGTFADKIKALPTVEPKKAYWVVSETAYEDEEAKCSRCGFSMLVNQPCNGLLRVGELKFCPHCGAVMVHIEKMTNEETMLRIIDNWRQKPDIKDGDCGV